MKFRSQDTGSKDYLRLKSGESVRGIFQGDPVDFRIHWVANKSIVCASSDCSHCAMGDKSSFRFKINVIVKENEAYVCKIFEQGFTVHETLRALHEGDYNLENHVMKITRQGTDKKTTYSIVPIPNGEVTPEMAEKLKEVKLHNISGGVKTPFVKAVQETPDDEPWETPNDSEEIPF